MAQVRQRIVLGTTNPGKIRELAAPLAAWGMEVSGLDAYPEIGRIEETGTTLEENALIKARTVALYTGLVSVADDSGLMVDALDGQPGIHSARFADDWHSHDGETRDRRYIRKLLHVMSSVPEERRGCRFVACMAAVRPDGMEMVVQGVWEGRLLAGPLGENGFGYDPIFFDPEIGKTAAQLTVEEKSVHSHRGKALRELLSRWQAFVA